MGLDMYLHGKKYFSGVFGNREGAPMEHGFQIKEQIFELGYWRKHPNLHGFIINTFANGNDDCEPINLSKEDIEKIIEAIKTKSLPATKGFFFGMSADADDEQSIGIFERALAWLSQPDATKCHKWVEYEASW